MGTNTKIAKNTFYLYIRMLFLMFVTFISTRVLLDKLGFQDYGLYNVVCGLASMFSFFSSSLSNASQRFLSVELGNNNIVRVKKIFQCHLSLYFIICVVIIVFSESIGMWFLFNKMVIPEGRLVAAVWIYQFMIISLCATLIGIVYNSDVISNEDMNVYSFVGMFEGISKLVICYIVSIGFFDRLILYGFLMMMATLSSQFILAMYCHKRYEEAKPSFLLDKDIIKEAAAMVGWNTWGTLVVAICDSGINILLNLFFGPVVNAARSISFQVSSAVSTFSANFLKAVNPQITKSYASNDLNYTKQLFFMSSKYGFFLLWIFLLPICFSIRQLLELWLINIPEYTIVFTILVLLATLPGMLSNPSWIIALANGNIKKYTGIGSIIMLFIFPISYICLKLGFSAISVFIVILVVRIIHTIISLYIIHDYLPYSRHDYFIKVLFPIFCIVILSTSLTYVLSKTILYYNGLLYLILFILLSLCSTIMIILSFGTNKSEKQYVKKHISKCINKFIPLINK